MTVFISKMRCHFHVTNWKIPHTHTHTNEHTPFPSPNPQRCVAFCFCYFVCPGRSFLRPSNKETLAVDILGSPAISRLFFLSLSLSLLTSFFFLFLLNIFRFRKSLWTHLIDQKGEIQEWAYRRRLCARYYTTHESSENIYFIYPFLFLITKRA